MRQFAANAVSGCDIVVAFSADVVVQGPTKSLEDSILRTGSATYAAKRAGKNCVITG